MKTFLETYGDSKHYDVEARAFHMFGDMLHDATRAKTSAEGRAILQHIEDWKIIDVFKDQYGTKARKQAELDAHKKYLEIESTDQIERLQHMFKDYGLDVVETKGNGRKRDLVTCEYDGVPYSLALWDGHGGIDPSKIQHSVLHYTLMVNRHHAQIKVVYDHLIQNFGEELGDVWVMCGGGGQLQAFFGNRTGYLGILYLTLENMDDQERLTDNGYLAACGNESFTLTPNWDKNARLFKDMNVQGVQVRLFGEADDEDDED